MKTKEPFAIAWMHELSADLTPAEFKVYLTIKSFASNGKARVALSLREIKERCRLSHVFIQKIIRRLIANGWIRTTGEKSSRIGGQVDVYEVLAGHNTQVLSIDYTNKPKVLAIDNESVNKNVPVVLQSKKEYKTINEKQLPIEEQDKIWEALNLESTNEIAKQRRAR